MKLLLLYITIILWLSYFYVESVLTKCVLSFVVEKNEADLLGMHFLFLLGLYFIQWRFGNLWFVWTSEWNFLWSFRNHKCKFIAQHYFSLNFLFIRSKHFMFGISILYYVYKLLSIYMHFINLLACAVLCLCIYLFRLSLLWWIREDRRFFLVLKVIYFFIIFFCILISTF